MIVMDELVKPETCAFAKKAGVDVDKLRYPGFDRPTQTSMLKHLREEYGYIIAPQAKLSWGYVNTNYVSSYYYVVRTIQNTKGKTEITNCRKKLPTMEEAYEEGIRKVLEEMEVLR